MIRKIILILLFSLLVLSVIGCKKQTEDVTTETPEEATEPAETTTVTGEAAVVSEGISDVDELEDDLNLDELEDLDKLLNDIDW